MYSSSRYTILVIKGCASHYTAYIFRYQYGGQLITPWKIKASMEDKRILLANRRGITNNFIEQEKPSFTPEELYENRKRGLSFSSIGKKLGIDNTKEEYKVMQECDGSLPDIETMETHALKSYPTPLGFCSILNLTSLLRMLFLMTVTLVLECRGVFQNVLVWSFWVRTC